MNYKKIFLKKGKDIPLKAGHPWVFSGGIDKYEDMPGKGDFINIYSAEKNFIGSGSFHPGNSIRIRIFSNIENCSYDKEFFAKRITSLNNLKLQFLPKGTDGYRLVHSDADMLPGLIIDVYGKHIVMQINTLAMENLKQHIIDALVEVLSPLSITEKSDMESRKQEGLKPTPPITVYGTTPHKGEVIFTENNLTMISDVIEGQKTGFFLDQRDARIFVKNIAKGKKVLNLFSYSGSFSIAAAAGGATEVTSVDTSAPALSIAEKIFELNKITETKTTFIKEDVFNYLAARQKENEFIASAATQGSNNIIICDPPAFTKKKDQRDEAIKAYIQLNKMCLQIAAPGTIFVTSSCSGVIDREAFNNILRIATGKAGKKALIIAEFSQAPDHTRKISFPEGSYLKTTALLVTE